MFSKGYCGRKLKKTRVYLNVWRQMSLNCVLLEQSSYFVKLCCHMSIGKNAVFLLLLPRFLDRTEELAVSVAFVSVGGLFN